MLRIIYKYMYIYIYKLYNYIIYAAPLEISHVPSCWFSSIKHICISMGRTVFVLSDYWESLKRNLVP